MKEFIAVFQLSKTIIFEVQYYTLSNNTHPYFTTSAAQFCKNKRDFSRGGQAQEELTKGFTTARNFWKKWDHLHLHDLTPAQHNELLSDMEKLKNQYNHLYKELDEKQKPYPPRFSFWMLAEWSKQKPKNR